MNEARCITLSKAGVGTKDLDKAIRTVWLPGLRSTQQRNDAELSISEECLGARKVK